MWRVRHGVAHSTGADARWAPSGFDIAGARRGAWLPWFGFVAACALIAAFYGVVETAVQRADRVHIDVQGAAGSAVSSVRAAL